MELACGLQACRFTVPGTAELGDVGCGPCGALGSSQQRCEAGTGDRGCWFHVGNSVAGRVVAPQKPQPFPAALLALGILGPALGV